jgi:cell division protease FtsH
MSLKPFRRSRMPQRGPSALALLFVLAALGSFLWWYNASQVEPTQIIYSQFLDYVEKNAVSHVVVTNGVYAQGRLADGRVFEVSLPMYNDIWKLLRAHNVAVDVRYPDVQPWGNLFILLLLAAVFIFAFFYFRTLQGGGNNKIFSMGKSKAKFISPHALGITFKDVAGAHEAKEELRDVVEFLKTPEKFSRLGAKIPRGVLLCGAPGNGKTLLAKAVAGEAHCPFFSISGSDFVEVFVGVGASRVRDLFAQARKNAPCIVFIDEIDAVGRQRGVGIGGGNDEREQTLNQLLAEMDGFATQARGTVIVLAATNRPDVLDKALLRPGRFDRSIEVPYPDVRSREQILQVHSKNVPLAEEVSIEKIARGTPGFSGADLENLINEAALMASKKNKKSVEMNDFEQARDRVMLGSERKTMIFTDAEKKLTAYHEGGHTLLNVLLPATDPFHKVTIVPRGRTLGVSWSLPEGDRVSASKTSMLARIQVCLGGLLAEKIFFNEQTTGAASDIAKATEIARDMVCVYGMSSLGPISFQSNSSHAYLGVRSSEKEYSAETAKRIDEEVSQIMMENYANAEKLLTEHKDKLQLLAETLIEKETMHAAEVYELLGLQPRDTVRFDQPVEM